MTLLTRAADRLGSRYGSLSPRRKPRPAPRHREERGDEAIPLLCRQDLPEPGPVADTERAAWMVGTQLGPHMCRPDRVCARLLRRTARHKKPRFPLPLREWAGGAGRDAAGRTIRRVVAGEQSDALIEINAPDCGPTPAARGTWPPVGCYACRTVQNRPNERRNARVPAEKIIARPGISHHAQENITAPLCGMGCAASRFRV